MQTLVRAVITGFGLSLGKLLFDKTKERFFPEEEKEPKPARVIVVNTEDFHKPTDDQAKNE